MSYLTKPVRAGLAIFAVIIGSLALGVSPGMAATTAANSTPAASASSANPSSSSFTGTPLAGQYDITESPQSGTASSLATASPSLLAAAAATGNTHCFASLDGEPHVGCQLDHGLSAEVISDVDAGALSAGAYVVCSVFAGPAAGFGCAVASGIVANEILGHITTIVSGQCLEVGLEWGVDPYAKRISCSIE